MTATARRYVTTAEAATILGISIRTLQRRIAAGELPTMPDGRRVLVGLDAAAPATSPRGRHEITDPATGTMISMPDHELAAAAVAAMRERESMLARVDRAEHLAAATRRRSSIAWVAAAAAGIAAALGIGIAWSASTHRDDLAGRVAAAEAEIDELRARADSEAGARRSAEADRDKFAGMLLDSVLAATDASDP